MHQGNIVFSVLTDGSRTVVEAALLHADSREVVLSATGSSGRDPGDKTDPAVGVGLATARALSSLAKRIERQANGRVKHNEDIAEHRRQIKDAPAPPVWHSWPGMYVSQSGIAR